MAYQYKKKRDPGYELNGFGPFEGAMLGLNSLLLAFTFNNSASHYDTRRELIVHETNCISTVLSHSDLYPDSMRYAFRNDIKEYIAARIQYYEAGDDEKVIASALQRANMISERVWNRSVINAQKDQDVIKSMQMLPWLMT